MYKLIIGSSKNSTDKYPTKCFWTQEKETRVKFNPGLSTNQPSNNWALNIYFLRSGSSPLSYLFTFATVRIPVHATAPECGIDSIRYVTLHFRDRRCTASLRYRNRAEITVLVCEQKPYPVLFSCRRKSYLGYWEQSLSWLFPVSYWIDHYLGYQRFFSRAAGIFGVRRRPTHPRL